MDSHKAVWGSRPGTMVRIRSVVISSDQYHSEVGSSIPNVIGAKWSRRNTLEAEQGMGMLTDSLTL